MYRRLALTFILIVSFFSVLQAQVDPEASGYYNDALRFASFGPYGTARFQAMGGVNASLGGDMSSLAGNPAGLGFYNRSEASLSAGFGFTGTTSTYSVDNSMNDESRDFFSFPNLGIVFNMRTASEDLRPFRGHTFGIGLTRMNSFQNRFYYSGINNENSLNDFFAELAHGIPEGSLDSYSDIQTLESLAYYTFLINPDYSSSDYSYYATDSAEARQQEETVFTRGAINQWNLSYGANISDKIYLGASLGLPRVRYKVVKSYREQIFGGDSLDNFRLNENLSVKGGGVNFKVGVIFKASDWVRIGASLQTPTYYTLNEEYDYYVKSTFNQDLGFGTQLEESTTPGIYKYNLLAPFRASVGISLFAGKAGFIAADIEYVPYNRTKLIESSIYATADNSSFSGDNKTIRNITEPVINFNIGGEVRKDNYRFRAGFSQQSDPYNLGDIDRKVINISAGAGVRVEDFYIDLAIVNSRFNSLYKSYTLSSGQEPTITTKNRATSIVLTSGVFF